MINLHLAKTLAWADFKLRYKGSLLGFFWSFLKPLLMMIVLYIVFGILLKSQNEHYALFLLFSIILWNYFVEATNISMHNILDKRGLIKSVYFDRKILVISSCMNAAITMMFNIMVFVLIFFVYSLYYSLLFHIIILIIIINLVFLFLLTVGFSFLLSALYVKYRDVLHIWEIVTQIGFWITPILYSITLVPQRFLGIYMLNPMARIIDSSRSALLYGYGTSVSDLFITFVITLVILSIGYLLYKHNSRYFAEEL